MEGRIGGTNLQSASAEDNQNLIQPNYPTATDVTDDVYEKQIMKNKIQKINKKED